MNLIVEICLIIIAFSSLAIMGFSISVLLSIKGLIKNANELTCDLKEKSASLNFLFRPLAGLSKKHSHEVSEKISHNKEKIGEAIEWLLSGIALFSKFKNKY